MADDNPDRTLSEPPDVSNQHRERTGSVSLNAAANANGDNVSYPPNGDDVTTSAPPPVHDPNAKAVHNVINSEIGVATLLNRLKQSIASAKVRGVELCKADLANVSNRNLLLFSRSGRLWRRNTQMGSRSSAELLQRASEDPNTDTAHFYNHTKK